MCQGAAILNQFKNMASLDYASIADNLTRELMVIFIESPEDRKTIRQIYEAGNCAKGVAEDSGVLEESGDGEGDNFDEWDSTFNKDVDYADTASKAASCTDNVDRYSVGKISGRLFAKFWANELKTNV